MTIVYIVIMNVYNTEIYSIVSGQYFQAIYTYTNLYMYIF